MLFQRGKAGIVIIGAGECGARAALALRDEGFEGPITMIGAEPHLPYERPPLSKGMPEQADGGPRYIVDRARLDDKKIGFLGGTCVAAIDRTARTVRLSGDVTFPYDKLLLATGASPRRLAAAEKTERCAYLRTYDDALGIWSRLEPGQRIAIIGGGFIGLELAALASGRGCGVTVVEMQQRLLVRGVPQEIAAALHARHEAEGVRIITSAQSIAFETADDLVRVLVRPGEARTAGETGIEADLIIVGIGAVPNVELAEKAGLAIDNGIVVDERLQTRDPSIFAAGDCCSFPIGLYEGRRVRLEAWRNAQDQGTLAARNLLGQSAAYVSVPWFWSDQFDLTLQISGLADEGTLTVRRDLGDDAFILFHLATDGRLVAASGIGRGSAVARDIRLAEMLIARRACPPSDALAAPETKLKALLAA